MYTCMCNWVTMLYSRKLTEHCKPAIMEKIKIILKIKKIKYCLSVDIFIDKNIIIDRQYFYFSSKFHKSILIIGSFGDNINNCIEI